jgi:hypothetical protein
LVNELSVATSSRYPVAPFELRQFAVKLVVVTLVAFPALGAGGVGAGVGVAVGVAVAVAVGVAVAVAVAVGVAVAVAVAVGVGVGVGLGAGSWNLPTRVNQLALLVTG